jgi:hypothetical protein
MAIGLLSSGAARAEPLTFYTNEADWLAAVSGFNIGTYADSVNVEDTSQRVNMRWYRDGVRGGTTWLLHHLTGSANLGQQHLW